MESSSLCEELIGSVVFLSSGFMRNSTALVQLSLDSRNGLLSQFISRYEVDAGYQTEVADIVLAFRKPRSLIAR